jgi:hypothetical protein
MAQTIMPADGKRDTNGSSRTVRLAGSTWVASLLVVLIAAKAALLALRLHDGAGPTPGPWVPLALLYEDLRLIAAAALSVGLAGALAGRHPSLRSALARCGVVLYGAIVFWTAGNVPVARALSSPLTAAMVHATGTAISDSVRTYVTPANVAVPLLLGLAAAALPRALRHARALAPSRWVRTGAVLSVAALTVGIAMGPHAARKSDVSGWHRNAVLTFARTSLGTDGGAQVPLPSLDSGACRPLDPPAAPDPGLSDLIGLARDRNIVWITLESTGARMLGAYGADSGMTPHLDELARDAVVFQDAYAGYPESIKGLYAVLCARLPPAATDAAALDARRAPCRTAATLLAEAGWRTGLFHSGWFAYLGMRGVVIDRGFETLVDAASIDSPQRTSFGVDDRATANRLLAFVDGLPAGQRFFAAFMPIAGHHPYHAPGRAPRPLVERDDHDAYLNEMHVADDAVGLLRAGLKVRGRDDKTVYVVVGDHGEAFREHPGNVAHALYVYEENVRIPFFIAAPGAIAALRRVRATASLLDLTPTTLALAGVPVPSGTAGHSLLDGTRRVARFFTDQGVERWGLRDGRWKLIWDADVGRARLFDLATDSGETRDVAAAHPTEVAHHLRCLGRMPL